MHLVLWLPCGLVVRCLLDWAAESRFVVGLVEVVVVGLVAAVVRLVDCFVVDGAVSLFAAGMRLAGDVRQARGGGSVQQCCPFIA